MAAPLKKTVELFYDVVSPYSWIGFEGQTHRDKNVWGQDWKRTRTAGILMNMVKVLCRYRTQWPNMDLKLKPFFLGGIMKESGNKPPAFVPNKGIYMVKDIERLGQYYGIPFRQPKDFASIMMGTLPAQRFLTAVDIANPEFTEGVSRQLWCRIWKNDEPTTKPEHFAEAARKAGLDESSTSTAIDRMNDQDVKDRLKQYTQEALNHGAFGSPYILAEVNGKKEPIFGSDRFPILAMIIGEEWKGPLKELSKL